MSINLLVETGDANLLAYVADHNRHSAADLSLPSFSTSATILAEAAVKFGKDIADVSNSDFR